MKLFASAPFRVLVLLTFFVALIGGFAWYATALKYKKDTAHLQFVNPDNELWTSAKQKAAATIDTFVALYPLYPGKGFVKFTLDGPSGFKEDIWAKVNSIGPGYVSVLIEDQYMKDKTDDPLRELSLGQLIDWMVEQPNGKIRGGYTTQALFKLQLQNNEHANKDSIAANLALFEDTI